MFSKTVSNSSEFLMMSQSAQNLYFHIGMNSDDDGFCEIFTIMRMTESKPDDLKLLHEKCLIYVVDSRVCIVRDWHENNQLRADRYHRSSYLSEKPIKELYLSMMSEQIKNNSLYSDLFLGLPNGNQMATQARLGKVSLDKVSKKKVSLSKEKLNKYKEEILIYWNSKNIIVHRNLSKEAEKEIEKIIGYPYKPIKDIDGAIKDILKSIDVYSTVLNGSEYWWSHKWNLFEFLKRGNKQFEGKSAKDYIKGSSVNNNKVDKFN